MMVMKHADQPHPIDVEQIMQEIRSGIIERQAAERGQQPIVSIHGHVLPAEFYEHLFLAGLSYDQLTVTPLVTRMSIPVIGRWLEKLRAISHAPVVLYVNQLAGRQQRVNGALLRVLDGFSRQLESESGGKRHVAVGE